MMTRRHFKGIAEAVALARRQIKESALWAVRPDQRHVTEEMMHDAIWCLVGGLADVCEGVNEDFDRDGFYADCARNPKP